MADNLSITNLNGVTEDEDTTCGINDMNCLSEDEDTTCGINDMNCVARTRIQPAASTT